MAFSCPNTLVVSISDREGDIYEVLEHIPSDANKVFWLIRSNINRKTSDTISGKIYESIKASEPLEEIEFKLPSGKLYKRIMPQKRKERKTRVVKQYIKSCSVNLSPPKCTKKKLSPIAINIIHCVEIAPPSSEDCIECFLITSIPLTQYFGVRGHIPKICFVQQSQI
jgi:hypothetical protein